MKTDMGKENFWNKITNLVTKLVNVLQGNEAVTMRVTVFF